jgi:hypothetical protein
MTTLAQLKRIASRPPHLVHPDRSPPPDYTTTDRPSRGTISLIPTPPTANELAAHLMKHPNLILLERSNNAMQHSSIMEQRQVLFLPIDGVDELTSLESSVLFLTADEVHDVLTSGAIPGR